MYSLLLFSRKVSKGFTKFCLHGRNNIFVMNVRMNHILSLPGVCWILNISLKKF